MSLSTLQRSRSRPISKACFETLEDRRLLSFTLATSFPVGANPQDVVTADFNNDGKLDLATSNYDEATGDGTVSVLLGNGGSSFQPARTSATGPDPVSLAAGDFNADGKPDLATANSGGYWDNDPVSILLGHGDGTFAAPVGLSAYGEAANSVATGDLNADGKLDLVVSTGTLSGYVSVLLGHGDGTFADAQTPGEYVSPFYAATLADFNGDGKLDVATARYEADAVAVFLGYGDGTLQEPRQFAVGINGIFDGPDSLAAGDFNADGKIDLATANSYSNSVSMLLGNGNGNFQTSQQFAAGNAPHSASASDVNGNGKLDLVVANLLSTSSPGAVSVLLGNGNGSLAGPITSITSATGGSPSSVVMADFNGDGRPDAAAANTGSNNVSVLLNDGNWGTKTYVGANGGNWSTAANWSPGGVPTASDHVLISGKSVNLAASATVGELTLAGNASLAVAPNGNHVLQISALFLSADSRLDLSDNDLIVDYGGASQLGVVQALVNSARHGGDWLGAGLTSSAARDNPRHNTTLGVMEAADYESIYGAGTTFDGQAIDTTAVLVKYTYYGDTDFNGKVNFDDYVRTDNGFNNHNTGWTNGDFNGDGQVNFDDYVLIDLAFNTQGSPI
jgi:hypothetical protein